MLNWCSINISYYTRFVLFNIFEETLNIFIWRFKRTAIIWNRNLLLYYKCLCSHFWSIPCTLAEFMGPCWRHWILHNVKLCIHASVLLLCVTHFLYYSCGQFLNQLSSVLSQIMSFVLLLLQKQKSNSYHVTLAKLLNSKNEWEQSYTY